MKARSPLGSTLSMNTPEDCRNVIYDMFAILEARAVSGMRMADIGDDVGLGYMVRCTEQEVRTLLTAFIGLKEMNDHGGNHGED